MTSEEVQVATGITAGSVSSRVAELVRADCLIDTLEQRRTAKGKKATVYRIDPQATEERYLVYVKDRSVSRPKKHVPILSWEDKVVQAAKAYRKDKSQASADKLLKVAASFTIGLVKVVPKQTVPTIDGIAL